MSDQVRDALHDALCAAVASHEKAHVIKWFAMVETMDAEGQRGMWSFTSPGATSWDNLGMLRFADNMEQIKLIRDLTGGNDD